MPLGEQRFVGFRHESHIAVDVVKISEVAVRGANVVLGVIVEPKMHDDGGKQMHCAELDAICRRHEHEFILQFNVEQASKFEIIIFLDKNYYLTGSAINKICTSL